MKISLDKIICESNRKYTKDEGFEQFLNSVKQYGILEPPLLREMQDGRYKTIAGRRRIAAARQLGYTDVDCVIREQDDPIDDEEIALTENVNRLDMHPLDEAAVFKRMADEGNPIEEIARYYARSPSAIYKRLRLVPLIEELKGWFRDQVLDISGAALLAELPEEDQKKFYELHEARITRIIEYKLMTKIKIDNNVISQFVYKQQKNKIRKCLGNECQVCDKRTHNSDNDLFDEFKYMDDVCLDGDCYRAKWKEAISQALAEKCAEYGPNKPDCKILFKSNFAGGIPEQLYKKATHAIFDPGDGEIRFEVLKEKDWEFTGETNRKNGACYEIGEDWNEENIKVRRIGYKEKKKEERNEAGSKSNSKEVEQYDEALKVIADERETSAAELVKALKNKNIYDSNDFNNKTGCLVYEKVVARRIEAERSGAEPPGDYFSIFLRLAEDEFITVRGNFLEEHFNDQQKQWLRDLTGKESIKKISLNLSDETQMLFHFLILCIQGLEREVPDLNELKNIKKSENLFWEYARMDEEEYRALYIQAAKEVTSNALDKKPKKTGKKNDAAEAAAPHGEDVPADASGAGSPSSKRKKAPKKDGVHKCRICGCIELDSSFPRYLVGADICNVCENKRFKSDDEDNYPFEPDEEEPEEIDNLNLDGEDLSDVDNGDDDPDGMFDEDEDVA